MFLVRYSRISVIRHELTAAALSSNVDRTPAEQRLLAERADEVVLIELRGYLFFGTASGVVDAVRRRLDPDQATSVIVFDFERVIGIDSSTVVAFEKIGRLAAHHGVTLALAGADQHIADALLPHLGDRHDLTVVQFDDADRALQFGEELILGSHGDRDHREPTVVPVGDLLGAVLDDQAAVAAIAPHLCCVELTAGERLIEQDRPGQGLFFLERGRLTAFLERPPRAPLRLRTMLPGAVVGEISQYSKGAASATVCADQPSVVWRLGGDEFDGLARTDPKAAAALHLFVARVLTERVTHAEKTVRDLRR
jgi:SulP family sulfate permease